MSQATSAGVNREPTGRMKAREGLDRLVGVLGIKRKGWARKERNNRWRTQDGG